MWRRGRLVLKPLAGVGNQPRVLQTPHAAVTGLPLLIGLWRGGGSLFAVRHASGDPEVRPVLEMSRVRASGQGSKFSVCHPLPLPPIPPPPPVLPLRCLSRRVCCSANGGGEAKRAGFFRGRGEKSEGPCTDRLAHVKDIRTVRNQRQSGKPAGRLLRGRGETSEGPCTDGFAEVKDIRTVRNQRQQSRKPGYPFAKCCKRSACHT